MQTLAGQERFLNGSVAHCNFERTVEALGLSYRIQQLSEVTSICILEKDGEDIERGNGKGIGLQSQLSAQYEALEHYFVISHSLNDPSFVWHSYAELKNSGENVVLRATCKISWAVF